MYFQHRNFHTSEELIRGRWYWFLFFGVLLLLLGAVALVLPWLATLTTVVLFGWLLLLGGFFEVISGFLARGRPGMFTDIIMGALSMTAGLLMIGFPDLGAVVLTVVLAGFFILTGAFRLFVASLAQFPGRTFAILSGVIAIVLGILVALKLPESAMWVIGVFVGIELILRGVEWLAFSLILRRHHLSLPSPRPGAGVRWA